MKYLIDTSALVRLVRGQVRGEWDEMVERGLIAICEPVLCEALAIADTKTYERTERELRATYPWVPTPDEPWIAVNSIRKQLALRSAHRGLSVADYLVVATAMRSKLTVLHEDGDFETVGRTVQGFMQQRLTSTA